MKRVVAIGNFDGVHIGHQQVLRRVCELAQASGVRGAVLTFDPHPVRYFEPTTPEFLLVPASHKVGVIQGFGIDDVIVQTFDEAFAGLSPGEFATKILSEKLNACTVLVGAGFQYGARRAGNVETLKQDCDALGIELEVVEPTLSGGEVVSSSRVRKALSAGDLTLVTQLMGRQHRTFGTVIRGDGIGRTLGFPTANVDVSGCILPPEGIYATYLHDGENTWKAATYVGTRPTFQGKEMRLEAFVLDVEGLQLYGENVSVEWVSRVRGDAEFESSEALVAQMNVDVENVHKALQ